MSLASSILEQGADVIAVAHNDVMTLLPINAEVGGYAQEVRNDPESTGSKVARLYTGEDEISHVVHIRRSELLNVTLSAVNKITQDGSSKAYRVKHVADDPNTATVAFYCILA